MVDHKISKEKSETRGRYITVVDGLEAELTFSKMGDTGVIADHTGVPEALEGRGVGQVLSDKCAQVSVLQQPQSVRLRRGRATR
jgi:predicted GNAT family acetyltransferase